MSGTYHKPASGLTALPVEEVLQVQQLTSLDLSDNQIESIPFGLFPKTLEITVLRLPRNHLKALPDDIGALRKLQILDVSSNQLSKLPGTLSLNTTLVELHAGHNLIHELDVDVHQWTQLKVVDLSHNKLELVPADLGWLGLSQLKLEGNSRLRIPHIVQQRGFKATMSYLQVICEQHRLVEQHLDMFANPPGDAATQSKKPPPKDPSQLPSFASSRVTLAASTGILDLVRCATEAALRDAQALQAVYVADLRHNKWPSLPQGILGLPGLVVLNASHNELKEVQDGVVPQSLGVLNLSFNKLKALPSALGSSPVLQQMYLANNRLTDLPTSFSALPMVDLFLSENEFTTIPKAVMGMSQLAKLSIACCKLVEVPPGLGKVVSLRFLDLSFNDLNDLPEELSRLTGLNALNISFNPMPKFPTVIARLGALMELNLDYTGITDLPPEIGRLRRLEGLQVEGVALREPLASLYKANPLLLVQIHNTTLTSLDLSNTGLTKFPTQLTALTGLTALNLSKNKLTTLPPELGQMSGLQQLNVSDNPLATPFKEIVANQGDIALVDFCNKNSDKVDLSGCGLDMLPPEVLLYHGDKVQQLKLANNKLAVLPKQLAAFTGLTTAVLDNNQLSFLPEVLLKLPQLSICMASVNQIQALPADIGQYTQLQALVLQSNQITSLPESISCLVELKALSLALNRLEGELSPALGGCTSLRLLDVSGNQLTSLPSALGALVKLKTLKASGNKLSWLPSEMSAMRGLQEVAFSGNTFALKPEQQGAVLDVASAAAAREVMSLLLAVPKPALPPPAPKPPKPVPAINTAAATAAAVVTAPAAAEKQAAGEKPAVKSATQKEAEEKARATLEELERVKAARAALLGVATAPALNKEGPRDGDSMAQTVVAALGSLAAPRPSTAGQRQPEIVTAESPEAAEARLKAAHDQAVRDLAHQKWLYIQKHVETVAQDPLRKKQSGWDSVPLMTIPRIIAAISNPPPPPPQPAASSVPGPDGTPVAVTPPRRPQTLHRFKRVVEQSTLAMQLLGRVNDVLQSRKPATGGSGGSETPPEASPPPPVMASAVQPQVLMPPPGMVMQQQQPPMDHAAAAGAAAAHQAYMQAYQAGYQQYAAYAQQYSQQYPAPGPYGAPQGYGGALPPGYGMPTPQGYAYPPPGLPHSGSVSHVPAMYQKKVGNKVVLIPTYQVVGQEGPPAATSPGKTKERKPKPLKV